MKPTEPPILAARLDAMLAADAARLAPRLADARSRPPNREALARLDAEVARATDRYAARLATRPAVAFPPELPVSQRATDIAAAIREHPVVIVCGETGSGKTTQLPKICLEAGRGTRGLIGHTQPRRLAARMVATRIAQEMGTPLGAAVGFKVRFADQTSRDGWIKVMTDGILLAETRCDRRLLAYDTIIVDEAHERSLNIDFLLGYLKTLAGARPDLKLVITSATLDADRFARHFGSGGRDAPVIEVSGRLYPVEIRWRPAGGDPDDETTDDEGDVEEAIVDAAAELWREGPGDILAFLPGEREIRETAELARADFRRRPWGAAAEIVPLFARLSPEEQQRAFAPSRGRRLVLATNVAETSLTVPGVRYVIDTGLARIKRYSPRNRTTQLAIEKIARANADQRAGRSGRVQDGVCVRLYAEDDYAARARFAEPEILRSSLASVILQMASLELGDVAAFPFVEPPLPRAIADGYQLLADLGAVDARRALTPIGRELAALPLDPRIGRIVLAARERDCVAEALVIASALSVRDPRERPLERAQAADQAHLRFRDERSDFLSLVNLWQFFAALGDEGLSQRRQLERCREVFVNHLRMREWRDVHRELAQQLKDAGWTWRETLPREVDATRYRAIHETLLAGLVSNVGLRDADDSPRSGLRPTGGDTSAAGYSGPRGIRFHLHPGSGLAKKGGRWILAAELVETSRLYARCAARVEAEWIVEAAGDRVALEHFEPAFDPKRGEVVARERVKFEGLTLIASRPVSFGRVDPKAAREVFLREALAGGTILPAAPFLAHNRRLVAEVAELEHKARRQDVLVDEEAIVAFYDERVPADVCTTAAFEAWRAEAERRDPRVLFLTREALMRHAAAEVTEELFPEVVELEGAKLPLKYRFAPGHPLDGLTLTAPLALLNRLDADRLSWLVPGMQREKVGWYFKSLPKAWRNRLVPLPASVTAFLQDGPPGEASLPEAIRGWMRARFGDAPPPDAWTQETLPPHLSVLVSVVDDAGRELAAGRDLAALREQLGEAAKASFAQAGGFGKTGMRRWDVGDLPETLVVTRGSTRVTAFPALEDDGDAVSLVLGDTRESADASTRRGVLRLLRIALKDALAKHEKGGAGFAQAALALRAVAPADRLLADVLEAIADRAFLADDPLPRSAGAFDEQVKRARTRLPAVAESAFRLLAAIAAAYQSAGTKLAGAPPAQRRLASELEAQRRALVRPGFFSATPWAQLQHLPRYLEGLERRYAKAREHPERESRHGPAVADWSRRIEERLARPGGGADPALDEIRWLLEELKVSLFAQELRTPFPVSFKRLEKAWAAIERR